MIYEFTRPGDNEAFVTVNNPSPEMLAELRASFPDMEVVERWSCPICYQPSCHRECKSHREAL